MVGNPCGIWFSEDMKGYGLEKPKTHQKGVWTNKMKRKGMFTNRVGQNSHSNAVRDALLARSERKMKEEQIHYRCYRPNSNLSIHSDAAKLV